MFLALDISTSCTGWAIFDLSGTLIEAGAIQSPKNAGSALKMDYVSAKLLEVVKPYKIDFIIAEEALKKFSPGMSNAQTLAMLAEFNFCLNYLLSRALKCEYKLVDVRTARRKVGIKVPKGANAKECVMSYIKPKYPNLKWELKKTGKPKDWTFDMSDAILIGEAAI